MNPSQKNTPEKPKPLQKASTEKKPWWAYLLKDKKKATKKKGPVREWIDAVLFALVAAVLIRTFLLEAFMIPTASMERSLMVGDFLVVSKVHYGVRMPMAPLTFPLVHNTLPFSNTRSWLSWITLPYMRIPGFVDVERNDVVVFNYPADDITPQNKLLGPVDIPSLKENYIKRCVAVPTDTFEIRDAQVYINGKKGFNPPEMQLQYTVRTSPDGFSSGNSFNPMVMGEFGFRDPTNSQANYWPTGQNTYVFLMPSYLADTVRKWTNVVSVERTEHGPLPMQTPAQPDGNHGFDVHMKGWTLDNYGPLVIPAKGVPLHLNADNLKHYIRVIADYEGHKLELRSGEIYIDGKPSNTFTPEMNYYFMMGDNRHNSLDSRYWGFVPEDHVVGKPLLVFFSIEGGIRWNRLFKAIE